MLYSDKCSQMGNEALPGIWYNHICTLVQANTKSFAGGGIPEGSEPIQMERASKGAGRAVDLLRAAEGLLHLAKQRRGCTNKDNAKLTSQIRSLMQKWK